LKDGLVVDEQCGVGVSGRNFLCLRTTEEAFINSTSDETISQENRIAGISPISDKSAFQESYLGFEPEREKGAAPSTSATVVTQAAAK
jgi:hypothetical protein